MRGADRDTSVEGTDVDVDALVERARRNGLRIIGPASMGVASPRPDIGCRPPSSPSRCRRPRRHLAAVRLARRSVLRLADDLDIGLSWFVSLGDKSDVSANDLLQFWEDDDDTRVIAMYTESFGNPRKFARIARRVSRTRPIVAVRAGRPRSDRPASALYQQAGLIEVPTVAAMLDTARVLATQPHASGRASR